MSFTTRFILLSFLISLMCFSCNKNRRIVDPDLKIIDSLITQNSDTALTFLMNIQNDERDSYNQAYYNLLLVKSTDYQQESLIPHDKLVDFSINNFDDKKDQKLKAEAWFYKGKIYSERNDSENAISCFLEAKKLLDENDLILFFINDACADIYNKIGLFDNVLKIYHQNLLVSQLAEDRYKQTVTLKDIGYTHFFLNELDSAYHYLNKGLIIAQESPDSLYLLDLIYKNLGLFYKEIGEYEESIKNLNKIRFRNDSYCLLKGILFNNMQDHDSAKYYLLISSGSDYLYTKASSYYFLSMIEEEVNNYKESNSYLFLYNQLRDSIDILSNQAEIKQLVYKYNVDEEISKVNSKNKKLNLIFLILFSLILSCIIIIILISNNKKKTQKRKQEEEIVLLRKEIDDTKNIIIELNHKNSSKNWDVNIENDIIILQHKIDELQCKIFKTKKIYSTINLLCNNSKETKNNKQVLNSSERKILKEEIYASFPEFIKMIKEKYTWIREEDIQICCLSKVGFNLANIGLCFGLLNSSSIRQRKYILKKKMYEESDSLDFFYSIFSLKG